MSIQTLQPAFATSRLRRSVAERALATRSGTAIEVLRTLAEIDAIAHEWQRLEHDTPEATGFQSYAWCRAWMAASGPAGDHWRIVAVRDAGRLVALLPFEQSRFLGARVLRWLGEPWSQYGDALVAADGVRSSHLAAAWRALLANTDADVIKLGRVRSDAALNALPALAGQAVVHVEIAPSVDLTRAAPAPDKRLRARRKRLSAIAPVSFEIVAEPERRRAFVREAIARKRAWLAARDLPSSGLFHPSAQRLVEALADEQTLIVSRLAVGEHTAAIELGLRSGRTYRSLLGTHNPDFAQGSPGHLLIAEMIAWAHAEGLSSYDLMVPADDYKQRWATDQAVVRDYLVVTRWRGRLAAAWFAARPAMKSIAGRMPGPFRRAFVRRF